MWEKLDVCNSRITSQLPLVPDPQLLGPGTKYRHIQQVTENQGFYQIKKFVHQNTPEKKHIHLG